MKRTVIKIDEDLCNGCGLCVKGCHEGALQLIDGKAVMVSDLYCDGLGACIGECPVGAIEFEEREAEPYNETLVMERLVPKGEHVVTAHLKHLADHRQTDFLNEGITYLKKNNININLDSIMQTKENYPDEHEGGCPGSRAMSFTRVQNNRANGEDVASELQQWPVQLHLLSPRAPYLSQADLLLAADCTAFSIGNFHGKYLRGKRLAIACPKLDADKEEYIEKLTSMIDDSKINTLTVMIMEVPCCGGLLQIAQTALQKASRKIPIKLIVVSLQGEILKEDRV
ncbi:MAG: 4Fe-4S binding protein [Candidatus Azobacteroides sp.]|nr:4Fe-4S binding protein [Candidatus Azobacteroides sp.]